MTHPAVANLVESTCAITTWADGFGLWHARVPNSLGNAADAQAARQIIIDELVAREQKVGESVIAVLERLDACTEVEFVEIDQIGAAIYREKS